MDEVVKAFLDSENVIAGKRGTNTYPNTIVFPKGNQ
jgi:hypothetical protein